MLAGLALEAAGADGSSGVPMREIDAGEILEKVQKGQPVEYDHVIVRGDLDLSWHRLQSPIRINDSIFNGIVSFYGSILEMPVNLSGSNFTRDVYFEGSTFRGDADFREVEFRGDADFGEATFSDYAYFMEATFSGDADFGGATFSGDAGFGRATFSGGAGFWGATFSGDADFRGATFIGSSRFEDAEFDGNIEFGDARFKNETSFYRILFKRPAYFEDCSIKSLNLIKAEYGRLYLRWDDIESMYFDEAAYLALIENYNTLGWYGDANRCYYDYRNAVRRSRQAASSPALAAKVSSPLDRLVDFGEWLLYGYGVRPSFPIAWCIGIILAFGLLFRQKRCLRKIITEEKIEDAKDGSDEVLVESKARKAPINFLDPFLFSLFTFTSGFTAFLHPAVEYKLERCLRWAIFERLLGPFFLALVITTISKTYLIR